MTESWGDQPEALGGHCPVVHDGVRRLHVAMLNNALQDLASSARVLRQEAWRWIAVDHEGDHPFSFHSVCGSLGLSVSAVRRQLREHGARLSLRNLQCLRVDSGESERASMWRATA